MLNGVAGIVALGIEMSLWMYELIYRASNYFYELLIYLMM